MKLADAIFAALMEHPTIARLVDGRIDPNGQLKQDQQFPRMTQQVLANNAQATLSGKTMLDQALVEIACWSTTKDQVDELHNAVNDHMQGYRNRDYGILGCVRSDQRGDPLPDAPNIYSESSNWIVSHKRG